MKKGFCLVLCLLLLLCGAGHAEEEYWSIPDCMRFSMETGVKTPLGYHTYIRRSYPVTVLPQVNAEIAGLVDEMALRPELQPVCINEGYLDVTCRVQRSGQSAMSFLVLGSTSADFEQTAVAFENRVYDMETGERILLPHLFLENSDVWQLLQKEVRSQLTAYYPQLEADEAALNALCQQESLENAAFSLTPALLELHYPAETLYPGRATVMHVRIPLRTLRPYVSDYGYRQTNNTGYQLAALTYDDGPVRNTSLFVMDSLMAHGANATFFVVGSRINGHKELLCREHDSGFSIASHNYTHTYDERDGNKLREWKALFDQLLCEVTGSVPHIMRAPGGFHDKFARAKVGLPLIHWSLSSGDATDDHSTAKYRMITHTIINQTVGGTVVLMHDLNYESPRYTHDILEGLEKKNILCVTVEELFLHYGVPLEENVMYLGCTGVTPPPY